VAASTSSVDNLNIFGGNVIATGIAGAGIGSGNASAASAKSSVGNVKILGGNVTAKGTNGAGIGSGYASGAGAASRVDNVTIAGGNITASGGDGGAGIGSGIVRTGTSSVGDVTITGGNISATGSGDGAAIGSVVSRISIVNGSFILTATSAGIGAVPATSVSDLTFRDGVFDCISVSAASCFNAASATFKNGSITVITSQSRVWSRLWNIREDPRFYFVYSSSSLAEELNGIPLLHLNSISLPDPAAYRFTIRPFPSIDSGFEQIVVYDSGRSEGCAFSVSSLGNYTITFESLSTGESGDLRHDGSVLFAADVDSDNLYSPVDYLPFHTAFETETPTPPPTSTQEMTLAWDQRSTRLRLIATYLFTFGFAFR
jgi:hypothetical protein